jgi:basic membrane protein A
MLTALFAGCSKAGKTTSAATGSTPASGSATSAATTSASAAQSSASGTQTKVALLLTSAINDAGWGESSYNGLMKAKDEFNLDTAYTENMELVDMESAIRDYVDLGYGIIVLSSADFYETAVSVAPQFPDTRFVMINGSDCLEPNMANFRPNTPECGFLAGCFAGLVTKTNTVGMIGGKSAAPVVDAMNGFTAGAKYVNDKANVLSSYLDSWTDINKGSEATLAMIESGADVVCANTSQAAMGTITAAQNKGILAVGYIDDQHDVAPGTVPFSALQDVGMCVYQGISAALQPTYEIATKVLGAADGVISLSDFYKMGEEDVPAEVQSKMQEIYNGILDGSLKDQGILPKSSFEK